MSALSKTKHSLTAEQLPGNVRIFLGESLQGRDQFLILDFNVWKLSNSVDTVHVDLVDPGLLSHLLGNVQPSLRSLNPLELLEKGLVDICLRKSSVEVRVL